MTRTYALKRLLEHGGMNWADLRDCTRWSGAVLSSALQQCMATGVVVRRTLPGRAARNRAWVYEVAP
jgi:predicted transcriptional regulator